MKTILTTSIGLCDGQNQHHAIPQILDLNYVLERLKGASIRTLQLLGKPWQIFSLLCLNMLHFSGVKSQSRKYSCTNHCSD